MSENILRMIKLPDLVTVVNALLGFTAILMVVYGNLSNAAALVVLAVVADGVDGVVAREIEHSAFGINLDSLADLVSFGVAPAMIGYLLMKEVSPYVASALSAAYLVCGTLRLARFNVSAKTDVFLGLPMTACGIWVALLVMARAHALILIGSFVILPILMVSDIEYSKIRDKRVMIPTGVVFITSVASYVALRELYWCIIMGIGLMGGYILSPLVLRRRHGIR
ncbi:MAG: CDP-diacylglycerol--serine O-phosphatidyltransferase [Methanocellales archaeon]|nr:CDP-diacylglycerol--serine O-phosphatidyltransferase [Methanocellales archaeon]